MAKTILISNKTYDNLEDVGKNYCHDSGIAYTPDRFFYIVNQTFDYQLKLKNRIIYWWLNFWYNTNDYKKNKDVSNKRYNKTYIFEKIFLLICIIGLILTLIFGLAIPIITSATKSILLLQGKALGIIYANNQLIGYVFTNSEASGILYNINTTINSMSNSQQLVFWDTLKNLDINNSDVTSIQNQVIKFGNTFMVIDLTDQMKKILYAYLVAKSDTLGNLDLSNLNWTDLVLSNNQAGQVILVPKIWIAYFKKGNVIAPIVFTLFFIVVLYIYNRRRKKVIPKINAMSLQDFLNFKINNIRKYKVLLNRSIPMVQGIKELNHRFIFMADSLGTTQLYYNIRLMNYIYSVFKEMNCIMTINAVDDNQIEQIQKICLQDFDQNINVIIIDTDKLNELKSKDKTGYLFSDVYLEKISQEINLSEISNSQKFHLNEEIRYKEYMKENYDYKIENQIKNLNKKIDRLIFRNRKRLSNKRKKEIVEDIVNKYNLQKEVIQYNFEKSINSIKKDD